MQIQQWDNIFYRFYPADKRNYKGYSVVINADLPTYKTTLHKRKTHSDTKPVNYVSLLYVVLISLCFSVL